MFRIKIALIVGGIALLFFGVQEWRLSQAAKEAPQTITCADLSAKGPGDNANIVLTDCLACEQSFVYETKGKNQTAWQKVWVPMVPLDGEYAKKLAELVTADGKLSGPPPTPQNIKVIVKSSKVSNEAEMSQVFSQPTITGLVTNKIESLGSKERKILEDSYPGTDFTQCWIVDHDRKPAGVGQVLGMSVGGLTLTLLGLGWMASGMRGNRG